MKAVEAFTIICMYAASADKQISNEEMNMIISILKRMSLFKSYEGDIKQLLFKSIQIMCQNPEMYLNEAIATLSEEWYETAFAVAVDILMSDGSLNELEQHTMTKLYEALGISKAKANQIIEVMEIKNKGSYCQ